MVPFLSNVCGIILCCVVLTYFPTKGFICKSSLCNFQKRNLVATNDRNIGLRRTATSFVVTSRRRYNKVSSMQEGGIFFDGDDLQESNSYNMSFDDDVNTLSYRIARSKVLGPGIGSSKPPENVYIVLFYPETENEGVHTIEFPKGTGNNVLLAFEDSNECVNFALVLRDQKFFEPTPKEINFKSLSDYCGQISLALQIVPRGTDLLPPHDKVDNMSYNQSMQQYASTLESIFEADHVFYEDEETVGEGALIGGGQEDSTSWQ